MALDKKKKNTELFDGQSEERKGGGKETYGEDFEFKRFGRWVARIRVRNILNFQNNWFACLR